jgi:hypothetical protein
MEEKKFVIADKVRIENRANMITKVDQYKRLETYKALIENGWQISVTQHDDCEIYIHEAIRQMALCFFYKTGIHVDRVPIDADDLVFDKRYRKWMSDADIWTAYEIRKYYRQMRG